MSKKSRAEHADRQYVLSRLKNRHEKLEYVRLDLLEVSELAQRQRKSHRVDHIISEFDPDRLGYPTVSHRGGRYYIVDGQHRIEALKMFLGFGWEKQMVQCWVHEGLSEKEEAALFLGLNDNLQTASFDKFKIGVTAGNTLEVSVMAVLKSLNLTVQRNGVAPASLSCVKTLCKIVMRSDTKVLTRTLKIMLGAWGDNSFDAPIVDGLAYVCQRYGNALNDKEAIEKLSEVRSGVRGLMHMAEKLRLRTGGSKAHSIAAAIVEVLNRGHKGAKRLPSWWETEVEDDEMKKVLES